jgi:predicted DNA-binding WGR domain protein
MLPESVDLCLIEPSQNRFRRYRVEAGRTLFGEPYLIIEWGRIGKRLRRREEVFGDDRELERRRGELLARRRRHGYAAT